MFVRVSFTFTRIHFRDLGNFFLAALRRVFVDLFLLTIDKVRQWVFHFRLIEFTFDNMCTPACVHSPLSGCVCVHVCVSLFVAI